MHRKLSGFTATSVIAAATFTVTLGISLAAMADTSLEDAKDYRQSVMSAMGGHISAISMNVRGLVEDHGFLAKHAESLATTASELEYLFPADSNVDDSEALPAIWEEPEEFAEAVTAAQEATAAFSEVAASGDKEAIDAAFREVAGACKGCHDRFRKDDD